VTECRERFESLCGQSFKLRVIHKLVPIPGMQVLFDRFDTYALESSLKEAFGPFEFLFGGRPTSFQKRLDTKIALTSYSSVGGPYVFGNYNRTQTGEWYCDTLFMLNDADNLLALQRLILLNTTSCVLHTRNRS
jgi:hypothetical protein